MIVLAIEVTDPEKGALGVLVGTGVLVGGMSEKKVGEGSGVNVGRGVVVRRRAGSARRHPGDAYTPFTSQRRAVGS